MKHNIGSDNPVRPKKYLLLQPLCLGKSYFSASVHSADVCTLINLSVNADFRADVQICNLHVKGWDTHTSQTPPPIDCNLCIHTMVRFADTRKVAMYLFQLGENQRKGMVNSRTDSPFRPPPNDKKHTNLITCTSFHIS